MNLAPLPYFIGKNLVEIPRITLLAFLLTTCFYPFAKILCNFGSILAMGIAAAWHVSGTAMLLSITFNDKSAQLMMVFYCLACLLYGGVQTKLR